MKSTSFLALGAAFAITLPAAALANSVTLSATLDGASETDGGDADGSGAFSGEFDTETGDVCYTLSVADVGTAVAAHIHEGAAGKNGKPVLTIEVTGEDDDVCIAAEPDSLTAIVGMPGNYYVNVHTADNPKGAVRGQLGAE